MCANNKKQERKRKKEKKRDFILKIERMRLLVWLQSDIKLANIKTIQLALDKNEC